MGMDALFWRNIVGVIIDKNPNWRKKWDEEVKDITSDGRPDFGDPNRGSKHVAFMSKTCRTPNPGKLAAMDSDYSSEPKFTKCYSREEIEAEVELKNKSS
jgi:hypothetical protein